MPLTLKENKPNEKIECLNEFLKETKTSIMSCFIKYSKNSTVLEKDTIQKTIKDILEPNTFILVKDNQSQGFYLHLNDKSLKHLHELEESDLQILVLNENMRLQSILRIKKYFNFKMLNEIDQLPLNIDDDRLPLFYKFKRNVLKDLRDQYTSFNGPKNFDTKMFLNKKISKNIDHQINVNTFITSMRSYLKEP